MTDADCTAIAVLMDRSGSMDSIRTDAEGALRAFVASQAAEPGRCTIRLSHFDDVYETVYGSTPIDRAPDYVLEPRGMTALLDAVGRTVVELGEELAALPEAERPGTVIVLIQTDGLENHSRDWTRERVFDLITHQREVYGWDFVFLAANQDAIAEGARLGVAAEDSLTWAATGDGVAGAAMAMDANIVRKRRGDRSGFTADERSAARG
jgi:hypothetical protein